MQERHIQCVIPCGGDGTRMNSNTSKCLLKVGSKAVLDYVVGYWQSYGIEDFIFIVGGKSAPAITSYVNKLCNNPVIIDRQDIANLVKAIKLAEPYIIDEFILALGDCLNFGKFIGEHKPLGVGVCVTNEYEFRKSYLVQIDGCGVSKLVEKPPPNIFGLCGMGTLFLDKRFFKYAERLKLPDRATSVDFTGALQLAIGEGETITPVFFKGDYINITYPKDIIIAEKLARIYNNAKITSKCSVC